MSELVNDATKEMPAAPGMPNSGLSKGLNNFAAASIPPMDSTTSSNIVIKKSYQGDTKEQEYVLDANQIKMLKILILQTDFTRNLSTTVRFNDKDMYSIVINDNEAGVWLTIHCIGNEWISIANQFNGKHLKINNPNWKSTLEEILVLSE